MQPKIRLPSLFAEDQSIRASFVLRVQANILDHAFAQPASLTFNANRTFSLVSIQSVSGDSRVRNPSSRGQLRPARGLLYGRRTRSRPERRPMCRRPVADPDPPPQRGSQLATPAITPPSPSVQNVLDRIFGLHPSSVSDPRPSATAPETVRMSDAARAGRLLTSYRLHDSDVSGSNRSPLIFFAPWAPHHRLPTKPPSTNCRFGNHFFGNHKAPPQALVEDCPG